APIRRFRSRFAMRRTRLTVLVNVVWLAAATGALLIVASFGTGPIALGLAALPLVAGFAVSLWIGRWTEAGAMRKLAQLGRAVGLEGNDARSIEAIVASLCGRLDRAHAVKAAFGRLRQPAAVLSAEG